MRRKIAEDTLYYNKQRKIMQTQINFESAEDGLKLREDLADIQEYFMMNNREVFEEALKMWVQNKKNLMRVSKDDSEVIIND